jgi:uncharacterized protein YcbX
VGFAIVKGTRHLPVDKVVVDADGAVGDRAFCLVDVERKQVLRTVQHPALVRVTARLEGTALRLSLPTGDEVCAQPSRTGQHLQCDYWGRAVDLELLDGPHNALLSMWLGQEVRLAATPRRGVVYAGAVTLVTASSLRDLGERADHGSLVEEAGRFRATFVVETQGPPYQEEDWIGREISVGTTTLRVTTPIARCAVIDIDPATGARNGKLLKALAASRPRNDAGEPFFGVNAEVVRPGEVTIG